MTYSAFGLSLAADWSIPGLVCQPNPSPPDIFVCLASRFPPDDAAGEELYYASDEIDGGIPAVQVWKTASYYRLRYADGTQFIIDKSAREIRVFIAPGSTPEDAATYLLGPVLGFAMRLRGTVCLHASVVEIGGEAVAIAGPAGAGKSTAAAWFASMGHAVLSDDIAALAERGGTVHIEPAYPQVRLWPDSVAMLYGTPDALPRLTPTWDKRGLLLSEPHAFKQQALPLRAVYVLDADRAGAEPVIEDVRGSTRLLVLLANTYVGYLLDRTMRDQEFKALARLASRVRMRRVVRSATAVSPAANCISILEDCQSGRPSTPLATR